MGHFAIDLGVFFQINFLQRVLREVSLVAVGAWFFHRAVDVCNRQYSGANGNLVLFQAGRITAAIQAFMVTAHRLQPDRVCDAGTLEQLGTLIGVLMHARPQLIREWPDVIVQLGLDRDLSQIPGQRGAHQ